MQIAAGRWLKLVVISDAMLVLIGAVITAFVGYTGLVHRMAVDRCLPQVLLKVNTLRHTRHWVILSFWAMTSLLVLVTWGQLETVAGVYTVCFLSVMWSFSIGNMLLKLRRASLPTMTRASWLTVWVACGCISAGIVGNVIERTDSLPSLVLFGALFILPVQLMLHRVQVLRLIAAMVDVRPPAERQRAAAATAAAASALSATSSSWWTPKPSPLPSPKPSPRPSPLIPQRNVAMAAAVAASSAHGMMLNRRRSTGSTPQLGLSHVSGAGGQCDLVSPLGPRRARRNSLPGVLVPPGPLPSDLTATGWSGGAVPALKERRPSLPSRPSPLAAQCGTLSEQPHLLNPLTLPPTTTAISLLNRRASTDSTAIFRRSLQRTLAPGESLGCTHTHPEATAAAERTLTSPAAPATTGAGTSTSTVAAGAVMAAGACASGGASEGAGASAAVTAAVTAAGTAAGTAAVTAAGTAAGAGGGGGGSAPCSDTEGVVGGARRSGQSGGGDSSEHDASVPDKEASVHGERACATPGPNLHGGAAGIATPSASPSASIEVSATAMGCGWRRRILGALHAWATERAQDITEKPLIYFTKHNSPRTLSTVVRYVLANEQRRWIKFVRVVPSSHAVPLDVPMPYLFLQEAYPELTIEYVTVVGAFGPSVVRKVAAELHVPYTFIFMGTFDTSLGHSFTEMGGLRIITSGELSATALAAYQLVQD